MEGQFDNTLVSEMEGKPKRPRFLTVLCVFSFVCVGIAIAFAIFNEVYNTPENMRENLEKVRERSPAQAQQMEKAIEMRENTTWGKVQNFVFILIELVSLLGVVMMFNLKRMGFYIYAAIEILPYSMMFFGDGSADFGGSKGSNIVFGVIFLLIDLGFVVMYAMNLKHLKK
jgi:hypothetical protein